MPTVHDIRCPECATASPVIKAGLDRYRCTDCDVRFSLEDVLGE